MSVYIRIFTLPVYEYLANIHRGARRWGCLTPARTPLSPPLHITDTNAHADKGAEPGFRHEGARKILIQESQYMNFVSEAALIGKHWQLPFDSTKLYISISFNLTLWVHQVGFLFWVAWILELEAFRLKINLLSLYSSSSYFNHWNIEQRVEFEF